MPDEPRAYSRTVPLTALVEDPLLARLYLQEPELVKRIAANMRAHGFDQHRAIDVWTDGAGRGKHIIVEGHQRVAAARRAGLTEVRVAYRPFTSRLEALLWANEQQAGRRNVAREVQCLSVLRALQEEPSYATKTTKELSTELKFATATIDRCRQLLKHGTESEVMAVLDGTHGLKTGYDKLLQRRAKTDALPRAKQPPILTTLRNALAKAIDGGKIELPEALRHARWLLDHFDGKAPDLPTDESDDDE